MPSSRGSSQHRDQAHISCVSCITGGFFTYRAEVFLGLWQESLGTNDLCR